MHVDALQKTETSGLVGLLGYTDVTKVKCCSAPIIESVILCAPRVRILGHVRFGCITYARCKLGDVVSFSFVTCPSMNITWSLSVKSIMGTAADDIAMMINEVNNVVVHINLIICGIAQMILIVK